MAIHARQYRPAYFSGFDTDERDVPSTAALLAIPWIAQWTESPKFHRWSVADGTHLMAEMDHNREWWVVASLSGDPVDLPVWAFPGNAPGKRARNG